MNSAEPLKSETPQSEDARYTREADARYTREYLDLIAELGSDEANRRAAWQRMGEGSAYYHGLPVAFSYLPRLMGGQTRERFEEIGRMTYGILTKVIKRYQEDPEYRREFRFDPRVEELVLLPTGYDEPLPMLRADFVVDEATGEFAFVEFNTDSSSGMNETREALEAVAVTEPYRCFADRYELSTDVEPQFGGWVRRFLEIYSGAAPDALTFAANTKPSKPRVAIVACLDSPNPHIGELEEYRRLFEREGCACSVFDARELAFDGERLVGRRALAGESNVPIDCIWRFCIVVDLLEHWDEVQPFIEAVRRGKVVMIGGFSTQIVHDKQLFAVLRRPATQAFLTPEEREFVDRHIPFTAFLDDPGLDREALKRDRGRWVIKPTDWYASINVVVGAGANEDDWARLVDGAGRDVGPDFGPGLDSSGGAGRDAGSAVATGRDAGFEDATGRDAGFEDAAGRDAGSATDVSPAHGPSAYIVQEFCPPSKADAIPLYGDEADFTAPPTRFGEIVGVFMHAGDFGGIYVRQGPHDVIGSARAGLVAPVLWVGERG